jgi:hypothetical protein
MRFHAFSIFVMVVFSTLGMPCEVFASQVIATITGTVLEGSDTSGSLTPGLFAPPHTDLTGRPFVLTYTFDDTKGAENDTFCCGPSAVLAKSDRSGTGSSSPGNAVLQIGDVSYTYPASTSSEVYKSGGPQISTAYFYVSVADEINDSNAIALVYPATGTMLSPDVNWESSFTDSNLGGLGVYAMEINVKTPDGYLAASVSLSATSITVEGPSTDTPEPAPCALFGVGLAAAGALFRRRKTADLIGALCVRPGLANSKTGCRRDCSD